jgi:hypothetical protein
MLEGVLVKMGGNHFRVFELLCVAQNHDYMMVM